MPRIQEAVYGKKPHTKISLAYGIYVQLKTTIYLGPMLYFKEGFHQKLKTSDTLQFCLQNHLFVLFFSKSVLNFSGSISGPELTHPEASTSPSGSQYYTIRCPVLHHPGPVLHHPQPVLHHPQPVLHHPGPVLHLNYFLLNFFPGNSPA